MEKICFVCQGNTCRSPVAEKLLKFYFKKNNMSIKVCSVGLDVISGDNINEKSIIALKKYKISVKSRLSKSLSKSLIKSDTLFITMTLSQKQQMINANVKNVFTFGELVGGIDILDPYGKSQDEYDNMASQLNEYCKKLTEKLKQIKGDF